MTSENLQTFERDVDRSDARHGGRPPAKVVDPGMGHARTVGLEHVKALTAAHRRASAPRPDAQALPEPAIDSAVAQQRLHELVTTMLTAVCGELDRLKEELDETKQKARPLIRTAVDRGVRTGTQMAKAAGVDKSTISNIKRAASRASGSTTSRWKRSWIRHSRAGQRCSRASRPPRLTAGSGSGSAPRSACQVLRWESRPASLSRWFARSCDVRPCRRRTHGFFSSARPRRPHPGSPRTPTATRTSPCGSRCTRPLCRTPTTRRCTSRLPGTSWSTTAGVTPPASTTSTPRPAASGAPPTTRLGSAGR